MSTQSIPRRIGGGLLALALLGSLGASAADAAAGLKSTLGGGYSQDYSAIHRVRACDTASDGHPVYAQYQVNGSGSTKVVYDDNGANNGCENTGAYSNQIYRHRIAVEYAAWPDTYGAWRYPS